MATDPATIDFLLDQLGTRGATYTTRRMFGEYCLYRDGLPVALVCDDTLFVKDTAPGRAAVAEATAVESGPPYPGARLHLRLAPDLWDEDEWLRRVLDVTAAALPPAKPRAAKTAKPAAAAKKAAGRRKPVAKPTKSAGEPSNVSLRKAGGDPTATGSPQRPASRRAKPAH